ncbi:MAG: hypothetical protein AAGJ93_14065, partial [Bacteroidota bacterium]
MKNAQKPFSKNLLSFLTALFLMTLFLSSCQEWEDPTINISQRPIADLDSLKNTTQQLASLDDYSVEQQLDSLLVWATLLKNYAPEEALLYTYEATNTAVATNRTEYQAVGRYYLALLIGREQLYEEGLTNPLNNAKISQELWQETDNFYWQADAACL